MKNWIPGAILDSYRPLANALKALDPTLSDEEITEEIRKGWRPFVWPIESHASESSSSSGD